MLCRHVAAPLLTCGNSCCAPSCVMPPSARHCSKTSAQMQQQHLPSLCWRSLQSHWQKSLQHFHQAGGRQPSSAFSLRWQSVLHSACPVKPQRLHRGCARPSCWTFGATLAVCLPLFLDLVVAQVHDYEANPCLMDSGNVCVVSICPA